MNNTSTGTSAEYIANLLLNSDDASWENDESLLAITESVRGFAIANGLDSQNMINALEPEYAKQISTALDHTFSRLVEITATDPAADVSAYIDADEAVLYLSRCKDADGTPVKFEEIFLPMNSINELGANIRPKYDNMRVYGLQVEPINAVKLYNNHKAEIIELNINTYLRDIQPMFDYFIGFIKTGLNNQEIIAAFDALDSDTDDNDAEHAAYAPSPMSP